MAEVKSGEENMTTFRHVAALDALAAAIDEGPANIDVASNAVTYDMSSLEDADLKDRVAYQATAFTEETKALEQMADLLRQGQKFVSLLYSYRSCSKALPMVQGDEAEAQRLDVHKKTFEVLRPEIIKFKQLMDFHEMAVLNIKNNVAMIVKTEQKKAIHSESLLDHIVQAIDMLIILDALKDMKACLLNDFSRYKRAFAPIRSDVADNDAISEEIHNLQMFLGNPQQPHNLIIFHLKTDLQKVAGYDSVISILLDHCVDSILEKKYLTPTELHAYYRVIPYLFYCMDGDEKRGGVNPFKGKLKFNITRIQKLFKSFPIIPLYGDMQIDVMFVLKKCQHWEDEIMTREWTTAKPQKLHQRYELLYNRQRIRTEYNKFTMDFTTLLNDIKAMSSAKKIITPAMLQKTYKTTLEGLQLLSAWSAKIAEQSAWKYAHPQSDDEYRKQGGKGEPGHEYEKVVRCNYNPEELYALIDVIGMIKGLGGLMMRAEVTLVPLLRRCIHDDLQIFLQQEVARPLRKAHKRNRKVKDVMLQLREIGCDWMNRDQQKEDYLQTKKELIQVNRDFPRRATAPTLTQIELIRRMMHTIFSPKSAGMQGGMFSDKDLKKEWIPVWENFYYQSSFYKYMLSFSDTIREVTDMSSLWYREFYLEMTKCIQFPISHSMPWIMTEFLIKTPSMKENMFFPMDIYNDAAAKALFELRQQFLYDEIEAELNLSFDQLIFHVSEDIFKYFKTVASSVLINKSYEITYFQAKKNRAQLINSRYTALMSQRTITLLGRSVDLQYLISQQVNGYLRKNIEYVIRRFESSELTGVVELHQLLENIKFTHLLLNDHLNLDAYDEMLKEINEDTSVGQFRGRIVLHVLEELINDIIPNFIYNDASQRFVRGPHSFIQPVDRVRGPSNVASHYWYGRKFGDAFNRMATLYKGYFGIEHIESMFQILDYREWPLILDAMTSETEHKIIYDFAPYAKALIEGMPPMKLPRMTYGVLGGYGFYDVKLKTSIGAYGPLKPQVFQYMKEVGNVLLFVRLLEMIQNKNDDLTFQQTSYLHNIRAHPPRPQLASVSAQSQVPIPDQPFVFGTEPSPVMIPVQQTFSLLAQNLRHRTDQPLMQYTQQAAEHALRLYAYEPEKTSIFAALLGRLADLINTSLRASLIGQPPRDGTVMDVEHPKDAARLFSCLQFIFCQPTDPFMAKAGVTVINDMATFGEGWLWTQALFIHVLGLRSRFELLDFGYHVTKIDALQPLKNTLDPKAAKKTAGKITDAEKQAVLTMEFIRNVKGVREQNNVIFSSLESYHPIAKPQPFACRVPTAEEKWDAPAAGGHSHQPSMAGGLGGAFSTSPGQHARAVSSLPTLSTSPPKR